MLKLRFNIHLKVKLNPMVASLGHYHYAQFLVQNNGTY